MIQSAIREPTPDTADGNEDSVQVTIARWSDRFYAWLLDYVTVLAGTFAVFFVAFSASNFETIISRDFEYSRAFEYAPISIVFFVYWIILEWKTGQSIGKRALRLKLTNLQGQPADLKSVLISSFGKAFILPLDVILGWIFTNQKRQRIFNRFGKTIVIKIPKVDNKDENIEYKMD